MSKQIFADLTPEERVKQLSNMAEKVIVQTYNKPLSDEEVVSQKIKYYSNVEELEKKVEEFKEVKKEHDDEKKAIETEMAERRHKIDTKTEEVTGNLFYCPNHDDKRMKVYDTNGFLIEDRKLTPDESNMTMFNATGQPFGTKGEKDINAAEMEKDIFGSNQAEETKEDPKVEEEKPSEPKGETKKKTSSSKAKKND